MASDPRLEGSPQNANEDLVDRAIVHAVLLERLKAQEVREALAILNQAIEEVLDRLERRISQIRSRGISESVQQLKTLEKAFRETREAISEALRDSRQRAVGRLVEIGKRETAWQRRAISEVLPPQVSQSLSVSLREVSPATIRALVTSRPFEGRLLRDWFSGLDRSTAVEFERAVRIGMQRGDTTDQIMARLRGTRSAAFGDGAAGVLRRHLETVIRTAVQHVANHARQETFAANGDVLKGWKFVATLDLRTSDICRANDGTAWPIGQGPVPPLHHRCRSASVPLVKSLRELGLDAGDFPPSTRASMDGQVPEDLTYEQWLRRQSRARQDEVLGRKRADLWRRGNLTMRDLVDERGRPLTLDQLEEVERRILSRRR